MRPGPKSPIGASCGLAMGNPQLSGILDLFSESKMSRFKFLVALNVQSTLHLHAYVEIFDFRYNIHPKIWLKGEVLSKWFLQSSTISAILKPFKVPGIIVHNCNHQIVFFRIYPPQPLVTPQSSTIVKLYDRTSVF
jgi:hypothetical protein